MRLRKLIAMALVFTLLLGTLPTTVGAYVSITPLISGPSGIPQLEVIERLVYGSVSQEGALMQRIDRLEEALFGEKKDGVFFQRVENLARFLALSTEQNPSVVLKLNALEWVLYNEVRSKPSITERISNLERDIYGVAFSSEMIGARLNRLMQDMWPSGRIHTASVDIPEGLVLNVALLTKVSSSSMNRGDQIEYVVVETIRINDQIVIPAGARGVGTVKSVSKPGIFGQQGRVEIDWGMVQTMDGREIPVGIAEDEAARSQSGDLAIATSIAGVVLLGFAGVALGALVTGPDDVVEVGTVLPLQTEREQTIRSLSLLPMTD